MSNQLPQWITAKLNERDWSQNRLAKAAVLSKSEVSRVLNGKEPSLDVCNSIARAFGVSPETVMRVAGLLPKPRDWTAELDEWVSVFEQLSEEDRVELLQIGRLKVGKREKRGKAKA